MKKEINKNVSKRAPRREKEGKLRTSQKGRMISLNPSLCFSFTRQQTFGSKRQFSDAYCMLLKVV